jgi:hypothetical protein
LCLKMIQQPPCKCWDFLCQMRWPHYGPMPTPPMHCQCPKFFLVLLQLGPCFLPHFMDTVQGVPPHIKYFTPLAHSTEQSLSPLTHYIEQSLSPPAHSTKQSLPPLAHSTKQSLSPLTHSMEQSIPLIKVKLYSSTLMFHYAYVISLCSTIKLLTKNPPQIYQHVVDWNGYMYNAFVAT